MWWYDVDDSAFGQAAAADLDQDDTLEIVFSTYRNDGWAHCLNAEDGSVHWKYDIGGCGDVAPTLYDLNGDDTLDVILPGSCNPKTFCFNGHTGKLQWQTPMRGSDSPPVIANLDNDPEMEIIHGEFGGYVLCLNADGSQAWELAVDLNSWIQTAPIVMDVNEDSIPDFIVANWNFGTDHRIFCFRADTRDTLWTSSLPEDYMYHGASYADLDGDGKNEIVIGDYEGNVYCLNAEDGSLFWRYQHSTSYYVGAPTSIADLDQDGFLDVILIDTWTVVCLNHLGQLKWSYTMPNYGQAFRGAALSDLNGDDTLDVVFGTSKGQVIGLHGPDGSEQWRIDLAAHYGDTLEIDHGPVIADFDLDGDLDVFVVGGHTKYPNIQGNYGRAYAISVGRGSGPDWPMFRRDIRRQACVCPDSQMNTSSFGSHTPLDRFEAYPNPMTDRLFFNLALEKTATIQLNVLSLQGKQVAQVASGNYGPGNHQFVFSPQRSMPHLASGIYLVRLQVDGKIATQTKIVKK
jgi:outer membrane protein assembly factor BamB